jgi:tight adherence protein C
MLLITSIATAAGIAIVIFSLLTPTVPEPARGVVDERLAFYGVEREVIPADEYAGVPFQERIVQPLLRRLSAVVSRYGSAAYLAQLENNLAQAGSPANLSVGLYLAIRALLAIFAGGLAATIGYFFGGWVPAVAAFAVGVVAAWVGVSFWLRQEISARRYAVRRALPDVIDFLVVAVDAGLGFDIALNRVVDRFKNPLTEGLEVALAEVKLGRGRAEALEEFGRRAEVQEVSAFVTMVVSTERLGVPIGQALRIQAQDLRWKRAEWARAEASKAPVRMTIPMVVLVFPTLWLILLGPSFIQLLTHGL